MEIVETIAINTYMLIIITSQNDCIAEVSKAWSNDLTSGIFAVFHEIWVL